MEGDEDDPLLGDGGALSRTARFRPTPVRLRDPSSSILGDRAVDYPKCPQTLENGVRARRGGGQARHIRSRCRFSCQLPETGHPQLVGTD